MSDIRYVFQATGQDAVLSAFKSIDAAATSSGRLVEGTYEGESRAAQSSAAVAERAAQAKERAEFKAADAVLRRWKKERDDEEKDILRVAAAAEKADAKKVASAEKAAAKRVAVEERANAKILKSMQSLANDAAFGAIRSIASFSTDLVGGAARASMLTQDVARRVSINARMPGETAVDPSVLRKEFENVAMATPGQSAADIGKGVQKYVDLTGDLKTARDSMQSFATVASATGATVESVAEAAASMGKQFGITKIEDVQKAFAILTAQGKGGALTMKDLAAQLRKVAAAGHAFGIGEGVGGLTKVGGLMQLATLGTKSAASSGTAVEAIFRGLSTKQKALHAIGVDTYDKAGNRRDINQLLPEIIAKASKGTPAARDKKLADIFGTIGGRGVSSLVGTFHDASKSAGGGQAGITAGTAAVAEAMLKAEKAATDFSEVQKDAADAQKSSTAQVAAAWEVFVSKVGAELMPALEGLVPEFRKLADSGAAESLITIFVALAQSAGLAIDAFTWLGLLKPKQETPLEALGRTKKELKDFDSKFDSRTHLSTGEEGEKRKKLQAAYEAADEIVNPKAEKGALTNASKALQTFGNDTEFEKRFVAARDANESVENAQDRAHKVAQGIAANPQGDNTSGAESSAQKKIAEDYSSEKIQQAALAHETAAKALEKAAADLSDAAKKGTVFPK